jgi:hypothetical protein
MVTSHPHRTSPVLRGKWVLENVLGAPPPPPPDVVPPFQERTEPQTTVGSRAAGSSIAAIRRAPAATG